MNPWRTGAVVLFAHEGGKGEGQAQTRPLMLRSLGMGATIDVDVRRTRDNKLVLHHDPVLKHGGLVIAEHDLATLRKAKPDLMVLDQLLVLLRTHPSAALSIEIKASDAVAGVVARLVPFSPGRRLIVGSFNAADIVAFKAAAPLVPTAAPSVHAIGLWLLSRVGLIWRVCRGTTRIGRGHAAFPAPFALDQLRIVRSIPIVRRLRVVDKRFVDAAHDLDLAVHVWTVNTPERARASLEAGVDGIFTDYPTVLKPIVRAFTNGDSSA